MRVLGHRVAVGFAAAVLAGLADTGPVAAWEPTKNVEFIVPAGTGGGADQMARMILGIIQKHDLMEQSLVVINKSGGAGAEGFLDVKASAGNPHKIINPLEPVHDAARDRRSVQLGGPDAGGDAGAGRVHPLGQRGLAARDGGGLHRRARGRAAGQDGRYRVEAGGPDHHRRHRAGDGR